MQIQISSGRGPVECERAVVLFMHELVDELKDEGFNAEIIEYDSGDEPETAKSVLVNSDIEMDHPLRETMEGSVLWICKSPCRPNKKRKNWYIDVDIFHESEDMVFAEKDLKFETMRSSGAGGQHVNKVETAVRVTHISTGISAIARDERSQHQNKKIAMQRLQRLIENVNQSKTENTRKAMQKRHDCIERGNPIRIYQGPDFIRKK
jgi:peptide chain release factor